MTEKRTDKLIPILFFAYLSTAAGKQWFSLGAMFFGVMIIVGTRLKWRFLVDPPENIAWFYNLARIRKRSGQEALCRYLYILGIAMIIVGIWMFFSSV